MCGIRLQTSVIFGGKGGGEGSHIKQYGFPFLSHM